MFNRRSTRQSPGTSELDRCLQAWHAQEPGRAESLSDRVKSNIFNEIQASTPVARRRPALTGLFLPLRRLALAALPLALLTLLLGWPVLQFDLTVPDPGSAPASPLISAAKQGGEVVFEIANGGKAHRIYRAGVADGHDAGSVFATAQGSFRDSLDGDGAIVFYRID